MKIRIDKKTTKNQPDFFPSKRQYFEPMDLERPQDSVVTTLPEVKPEAANVEAEAGESVFTSDEYFYKVGGKKHSRGGTDLNLQPGDFIFSDKLTVKGKEIKGLFDGTSEDKTYSFSDLAKKYGNNFNKFKKMEEDGGEFTANTGALMQDNLGKKLAQIAEIQEASKGYPQGQPKITDKYFAQVGGPFPYTSSNTPAGSTTPTLLSSLYNRNLKRDTARLRAAGIDLYGKTNDDIQRELYEKVAIQDPAEIAYMWSTFGDTNKGASNSTFRNVFGDPALYSSKDAYKAALKQRYGSDEGLRTEINKHKKSFDDKLWGARTGYLTDYLSQQQGPPPIGSTAPPIADPNKASATGASGQLEFSLPDTLSLTNALFNLSTQRREFPTRYENFGIAQAQGIQQNIKPYDYQSQINEVNKTLNTAANAANAISRSPQEQAAIISNLYGQGLSAASQVRGAEYNANAQLYNQSATNMSNLAVKRGQDLMTNSMLYNDAVANLNQNFFEDKVRGRRGVMQSFMSAYNNAIGVNTANQLTPNYQIDPFYLNLGFKAPNYNPLESGVPSTGYAGPVAAFNKNLQELSGQYPGFDNKVLVQLARALTRLKPQDYQDDLFSTQ